MEENNDKKYIYFIYGLEGKRSIEISPNFPLKIYEVAPNYSLYEIEIDKKKLNKKELIKIRLVLENKKNLTIF